MVHQGSDFVEEGAYVANNDGTPPYSVDQVFLSSLVNATTNIHVPAPLYSSTPDIFSAASVSCYSYVDANTNFLTDLQIPIDPAIYLAFPNRFFEVYDYFW